MGTTGVITIHTKRAYLAASESDGQRILVDRLRKRAEAGRVTLIFGAKDETHNNAVALKAYLEQTSAAP